MRKYFANISLVISSLFFIVNISYAQIESMPEYAMGTRSYAMGQSASISFSDAVAVSMNPANIINTNNFNLSVFYSKLSTDALNLSFGIVLPTKKYGNFGISNFRISIDGISARDTNNIEIESFDFKQNHFLLSYGRKISNKFCLGFNAKFVTQKMGNYYSGIKNIGLDFGFQYTPQLQNYLFKNIAFGIVIDNLIKPALKLYLEKEYLPREYRIIAEKKILFSNSSITVVGNYTHFEQSFYEDDNILHLGFEYIYKSILLWSGIRDNNFTVGFGLNIHSLILSYAYGKYNSGLKGNNVFSLSYMF